jgi:hypothetical protein
VLAEPPGRDAADQVWKRSCDAELYNHVSGCIEEARGLYVQGRTSEYVMESNTHTAMHVVRNQWRFGSYTDGTGNARPPATYRVVEIHKHMLLIHYVATLPNFKCDLINTTSDLIIALR